YKPNREIFHHIHLLDEESSTSFSLIVSTVCIHCKDVLSRIQVVVKTENDCIIKIKIVQSFSQNDIVKAFVYV
ncbi:hypothetical protein, partial [Anoxybacillus flavithermus]|uniref:hypothetical protein n=1 Tax=Anoxybacillus flavithermus TaxID=33934 RepID=UPI0019D63BD2